MAGSIVHPIRHDSGARDLRWQISREWCGHERRRYVVRFCDEWRGAFASYPEAKAAAAYMEDCRRAPLYHDGKPRREWQALDAIARESWLKNPAPR